MKNVIAVIILINTAVLTIAAESPGRRSGAVSSSSQTAAVSPSEEDVNPHRGRIVVIKDLLPDLSSEDRVKFMSEIRLVRGLVASQRYKVLINNGMSRDKIGEILAEFAPPEEEIDKYTPVTNRAMAEAGDVLSGLSEKVKKDFFEDMRYLDGFPVSLKIKTLKKVVSRNKFEEITDTFMPVLKENHKDAKPITQIKDAWCETVEPAGSDCGQDQKACVWQEGYICDPARCK